jgi:hypothetical protein
MLADALLTGDGVEVSLYALTDDLNTPLRDPNEWWRGGAAGIATARLT